MSKCFEFSDREVKLLVKELNELFLVMNVYAKKEEYPFLFSVFEELKEAVE